MWRKQEAVAPEERRCLVSLSFQKSLGADICPSPAAPSFLRVRAP